MGRSEVIDLQISSFSKNSARNVVQYGAAEVILCEGVSRSHHNTEHGKRGSESDN